MKITRKHTLCFGCQYVLSPSHIQYKLFYTIYTLKTYWIHQSCIAGPISTVLWLCWRKVWLHPLFFWYKGKNTLAHLYFFKPITIVFWQHKTPRCSNCGLQNSGGGHSHMRRQALTLNLLNPCKIKENSC